MSSPPLLDPAAVRADLEKQTRASIAQLLGRGRDKDVNAITALIIGNYDQVSAALEQLASVPIDDEELWQELQRPIQAVAAAAIAGTTALVRDVLIVALGGRGRTQ